MSVNLAGKLPHDVGFCTLTLYVYDYVFHERKIGNVIYRGHQGCDHTPAKLNQTNLT